VTPDRPYPRTGRAHVVADQHLATGSDRDPGHVEIQAVGARAPAGGDQQPLGAKLATAGGDHDLVAVAANRCHLHAFDHVDAVGGERVADRGGNLGLLAARQRGAHEHGHARAEVSEQLRLLQCHIATAQHDHRDRKIVELHRRRRCQVAALGQPGNVRDVRLGTGGDEIVLSLDPPTIDVQGGAVEEARAAVEELDGVLVGEVDVLLLAHPLDDLALATDQRREVDRPGLSRDPGEAIHARPVARLGRRQQRLGRDAADVDARPADRAALDHRHTELAPSRRDRPGERTAARPDDRQVVAVAVVVGPPHQQGLSMRRHAATCSALSSSNARPSASSCATRSSAIR
jgi:hypothetical protein